MLNKHKQLGFLFSQIIWRNQKWLLNKSVIDASTRLKMFCHDKQQHETLLSSLESVIYPTPTNLLASVTSLIQATAFQRVLLPLNMGSRTSRQHEL